MRDRRQKHGRQNVAYFIYREGNPREAGSSFYLGNIRARDNVEAAREAQRIFPHFRGEMVLQRAQAQNNAVATTPKQ